MNVCKYRNASANEAFEEIVDLISFEDNAMIVSVKTLLFYIPRSFAVPFGWSQGDLSGMLCLSYSAPGPCLPWGLAFEGRRI